MNYGRKTTLGLMLFAVCATRMVRAGEVTQADFDALKKEIAEMRKDNSDLQKKLQSTQAASISIKGSVDRALDSKYGPGAVVSTKAGKLKITGLVQVWYYSIQNDHKGLFDDQKINGISDTNEALDNDGFQVKRTDLRFDIETVAYGASTGASFFVCLASARRSRRVSRGFMNSPDKSQRIL